MRTALLVLVLLLAGCATLTPVSVSRGAGLATISVQDVDTVDLVCRNADPRARVLGCVPARGDGVTIIFRLPPESWGVEQAHLETAATVAAHELCHAVRQVIVTEYRALEPFLVSPHPMKLQVLIARYREDRCHEEDGGVLRISDAEIQAR